MKPTRKEIEFILKNARNHYRHTLFGVPLTKFGEDCYTVEGDTCYGGFQRTLYTCSLVQATESICNQIIGGVEKD